MNRPADLAAALPGVAAQAQTIDGVALAAPGRVAADGTLGVVTVLPSTGPADPATRDLLHRLRAMPPDAGVAVVEITGATAVAIDLADELIGAIPRYLLIIGPLELILLIVLVRPWALGLVAAVGSMLSIGATVLLTGALVGRWVPGLEMLLPVVALAVLLGLVLDQAVRSPSGWPRRGWSRTVGGAAVMVAVLFGALLVPAGAVTAAVAPAVLIGVVIGLVIGVLLDAVVVRLTLVPAAFTLLSRPAAAPPADAATRPVDAAAPAAGGHAARGVHSAEPDQPGRRVIEEALATPEARRGGRHRGG